MLVASKVGNLPSKFGHARPLGSRLIRYVRDGQTDGRTKATLIVCFPTGEVIIITYYYYSLHRELMYLVMLYLLYIYAEIYLCPRKVSHLVFDNITLANVDRF